MTLALQRRLGGGSESKKTSSLSLLLRVLRADPLLVALTALALIMVFSFPRLYLRTVLKTDYSPLLVIAGFMAASGLIDSSGAVARAAQAATASEKIPPLVLLSSITALLSMFLMNDTVLFITVPVASKLAELEGIPREKAVVVTAIAANAGSSLSPIGNPQNIIIWHYYRLSISSFTSFTFSSLLPLLGLVLLYAYLASTGSRESRVRLPPVKVDLRRAVLGSLLLALVFTVTLLGLPSLSIAVVAATLIVDPVARDYVDLRLLVSLWLMLTLFPLIPVVIHLDVSQLGSLEAYAASLALSQAISNVPATTILLGAPWKPLLLGVSIGGLGTIVGSLANIIAVRISKTSIRAYHRVAFPFFAIAAVYGLLYSALLLP